MSRVVVAVPTCMSEPDITAFVESFSKVGAKLYDGDPSTNEDRIDLSLFPGIGALALRKLLSATNSLEGFPGDCVSQLCWRQNCWKALHDSCHGLSSCKMKKVQGKLC